MKISLLPSHKERVRIKDEEPFEIYIPPSEDDDDWSPKGPRPKRKSNMTGGAPRKKRKSDMIATVPPTPQADFHRRPDDGPLASRPELELVVR